jgi:hypothetical protein
LLRGAGVLVVLLIVVTALACWRLSRGPISLATLIPRAEKALDAVATPNTITLDDFVLTWNGWRNPFDIKAIGVGLRGPDGGEIAQFNELGVDIFLPALLHGQVVPERIEVRGLRLSATRKADGTLDIAFAGSTSSSASSKADGDKWLEAWLGGKADGPLRRLNHFRISDAALRVDDDVLGLSWGGSGLDLDLGRDDKGIDADLQLTVQIGDGQIPVKFHGRFLRASREIQGRLEFSKLAPALLAELVPSLRALGDLKNPIDGSIDVVAHKGWKFEVSAFDLTSAYGRVKGSFDAQKSSKTISGKVEIHDLQPWLIAGEIGALAPLAAVHVPIDGELSFDIADLRPKSIDFKITAGAGTVEIPAPVSRTQSLAGATIEGRVEGLDTLDLRRADFDLGEGVVIELSANASLEDGKLHAQATAGIKAVTLERIATLWPPGIADDVREWIAGHIPSGKVEDISVELELGPTGDTIGLRRLDGKFTYGGLRLELFPQVPIEQITGSATFNAQKFDFAIAGARLADLEVTKATVIISHLDDPPTMLDVDAVVSGPVNTALAMVNGEPLDLIDPSIIAAADVGGTATTEIRVVLPLDGPSSGEVETFDVRSTMKAFSWSKAPLGLKATEGELLLHVDAKTLDVRGSSKFNGVPAKIAFDEYFTGGNLLRSVKATADLDPAALEALGLPSVPFLTGTAGLDMSYVAHRDGQVKVDGKVDLTAAVIELPEIGWSKPPGVPATLTVDATQLPGGGWTLDPVRLKSKGISADARVELTEDPPALDLLLLRSFIFDRFDFGATMKARPGGGYKIGLKGATFDLAPLITSLKEKRKTDRPASASPTPPLDIAVHLENVYGGRGVQYTSVAANAFFDGRAWERAELNASTVPNGRISLTAASGTDGSSLRLQIDNFGKVIDALGLDSRFEGGTLDLTAERQSTEGPVSGQVEIRDTKLTESDVMTDLLRLTSVHGLLASFTGSGLNINRITSGLRYEKSRLAINNMRIHADGLGIFVNGDVDFGAGEIDIRGALAPMGTLQRFIGHIPLIGRLLTGVNREGVIAANFSITGKLTDPEIKAQPLSMLTPGITRDLVKLLPDDDHRETTPTN